jgi:hypothetical protein
MSGKDDETRNVKRIKTNSCWSALLEPLNIGFQSCQFQSLHCIVMDYAISIFQGTLFFLYLLHCLVKIGQWLSLLGDDQISAFFTSQKELYVLQRCYSKMHIYDSFGKLKRKERYPPELEFTVATTDGYCLAPGDNGYVLYHAHNNFEATSFRIFPVNIGSANGLTVDAASNRVFISYSEGSIFQSELNGSNPMKLPIRLHCPYGICIHRSRYLCICDSYNVTVFDTMTGQQCMEIKTQSPSRDLCNICKQNTEEVFHFCKLCSQPNTPRRILSVFDQLLVNHKLSKTIQIYNFNDGSYKNQFTLPVQNNIYVADMVLLNDIVFIRDTDHMIHRFA